jgi:glutamate-5-semialdehyde dehydrogenase
LLVFALLFRKHRSPLHRLSAVLGKTGTRNTAQDLCYHQKKKTPRITTTTTNAESSIHLRTFTMRRTICRGAVQNILHDVQAAAESRTRVATSSFAQRRMFLTALNDELRRNREAIIRANRRDCDVFGQQQQQRGTPSVTIPPTMPGAAAAAAAAPASSSAGRLLHTSFGGVDSAYGGVVTSTTHGSAGQNTASPTAAVAVAPPRRRSSLEYVVSTALSSTAGQPDSAAVTYSKAATAEALCGGGQTGMKAAEDGDGSSSGDAKNTQASGGTLATTTPALTVATAAAADHAGNDRHCHRSAWYGDAQIASPSNYPHTYDRQSSNAVYHTEEGGGGGHLLLTPDHHLLISPLRLDKLHATIDYLLCQPDPIAVPPSCWLHPYAERGSGDASGRQHGCFSQPVTDSHQPISSSNCNTGGGAGGGLTQQVPPTRYGRCTRLTDQLEVFELPVPLGMVGILSRFRPRISLDAVAMGLFAGNTVLVDGGVSLYYTNIALMTVVRRALAAAGMPPSAVVCVESYDTAHRSTSEWLQLCEYVDLAVVCGPPKLYQFAARHSTIPLMRATGQFSSVYVDQSASFAVALEVILNSKFQKLGAANAVTTAIVHRDFPRYTELLMALSAGGAVLLGDVTAQERVPDSVLELASEEEYQGLSQYSLRDGTRTLCIKTVDSLAQALFFIESYGSKQSDCIVATDPEVCATYCQQVDTAVALVNASTRLSSGVPLGCGVDFAISTSKAHCRGPLTLSMMTTRKLVARSRSVHHGALR